MHYREHHYRWEWPLESSPEALWPLVADTDRFNRDTGVPAVERRAGDQSPSASTGRRLRQVWMGVAVEWDEEPFEWIRPYRFGVTRRYLSGPIAEMRVLAELTPLSGGGTRLSYQVWAQPRNLLGWLAIPVQVGWLCNRKFGATFKAYDRLAASGQNHLGLPVASRLAPGGSARLSAIHQKLLDQGAEPDLVARLIETVEQSDDLSLVWLRPYALADYWRAPRRRVLELCLLATRAGLLDFRWNLLCPLCRGAKRSSPSLAGVESQVHCDSCHIDFTVNFDRLVELAFRPTAAVRQIEGREYCIGGPQVTPHIVAQQLLPPETQRKMAMTLEDGRYRLRTPGLPGGQFFRVADEGLTEATLRLSRSGWSAEELCLAPTPELRFENATSAERLFILERLAWSDQAATAAEVTAMQLFRDLFASEALRLGEQISVGSLAVLFTDLRGSTRLYREIGDATAFALVMDHFKVLREAIAAEEGALVKTIGDAVMAVFRRPAAALRATLAAQQAMASPPDGGRPLLLKAAIHYGPCIAVTLNDRLDYFASTVNIAARLAGLSVGGDLVISAAVRADPEVADVLDQSTGSFTVEPFEATLKGFDAERFELWRVMPAAQPPRPSNSELLMGGAHLEQAVSPSR